MQEQQHQAKEEEKGRSESPATAISAIKSDESVSNDVKTKLNSTLAKVCIPKLEEFKVVIPSSWELRELDELQDKFNQTLRENNLENY